MSTFDWIDMYPGGAVKCRINLRKEYDGRPLKPGMAQCDGKEIVLRPMWLMEDCDQYPGEWALGDNWPDEGFCLWDVGLAWIASGDVEVIDERWGKAVQR